MRMAVLWKKWVGEVRLFLQARVCNIHVNSVFILQICIVYRAMGNQRIIPVIGLPDGI